MAARSFSAASAALFAAISSEFFLPFLPPDDVADFFGDGASAAGAPLVVPTLERRPPPLEGDDSIGLATTGF